MKQRGLRGGLVSLTLPQVPTTRMSQKEYSVKCLRGGLKSSTSGITSKEYSMKRPRGGLVSSTSCRWDKESP